MKSMLMLAVGEAVAKVTKRVVEVCAQVTLVAAGTFVCFVGCDLIHRWMGWMGANTGGFLWGAHGYWKLAVATWWAWMYVALAIEAFQLGADLYWKYRFGREALAREPGHLQEIESLKAQLRLAERRDAV